jgi:hypothetical protein
MLGAMNAWRLLKQVACIVEIDETSNETVTLKENVQKYLRYHSLRVKQPNKQVLFRNICS